jgi:exopolysaccharide biosynthesis protein
MSRIIQLLFCYILIGVVVEVGSDYVTIPAAKLNSKTAEIVMYPAAQRFGTNGTLALITNPIDHFHVYFPTDSNGNCNGWNSTANSSAAHRCLLATNGSPFSFKVPSCSGSLVSDGKIYTAMDGNDVSQVFGLTDSGMFVLGTLTANDVESLGFVQLLTGFTLIVVNGTVLPGAGGEIAPRTAIGVNKRGQLMIFVADGIEATKVGLTVQQLAQWLADLGAYHVLNLDGGGSTVMMYQGKQITWPHCQDTPLPICQRKVTTFPCII